MKATIQEIGIENITRDDARQLRNEILAATGGNLQMYPDKYPKLNELFKILSGTFESMVHGVHFVSKREE